MVGTAGVAIMTICWVGFCIYVAILCAAKDTSIPKAPNYPRVKTELKKDIGDKYPTYKTVFY